MNKANRLVLAVLIASAAAMTGKGYLAAGAEPDGRFDAEAAHARLVRILGDERPHPVDSAANDIVRARLVAEMRAMGLEPRVEEATACHSSARAPSISCAKVRNVLASIGPAEGKHLLIASHYDSNPAGPGASDAGLGVAAALEVMRQLRRENVGRPVTILLTDGEEAGLLGAHAFLERSPVAARVDSIINMEARGVTGRALMFETDTPNGAAIAAYAASAERPAANSLTADFAKLIPNSTDVEVFKKARWTTLNFAVIGNETRYHTADDNLAAFDKASLDHMGEQALAAARSLAASPIERSEQEVVYADLLGRHMLVLPKWAAMAGIAMLLLVHAYLAWKTGRALLRPLIAFGALLLSSAILVWLAQAIIAALRPGQYWRAHPEIVDLAMTATILFLGVAALQRLPGPNAAIARRAYWLIFALSGALLSLFVPGASIFFLFPSALAAAAAHVPHAAARALSLLAGLILFLTLGPLLALSQDLLGLGLAWLFAPVAALVMLPFLVELSGVMPNRSLLIVVMAAALCAWTAVGLAPAYSRERKQQFAVEVLWDADRKVGRLMIANDGAPLPQPLLDMGFRPGFKSPHAARERWSLRMAAMAQPGIEVGALGSQPSSAGGRITSLHVRSPGASAVLLRAPASAKIKAVRLAGVTTRFNRAGSQPFLIRCSGRNCADLRVDLLLADNAPLELEAMRIDYSLPALAARAAAARPRLSQPQYAPDLTVTLRRIQL